MSRMSAAARHVVARITFEPKSNDGPVECACSWSGRASGFAAHRAEVGAPGFSGNAVRNEFDFEARGTRHRPGSGRIKRQPTAAA